MLHDFLAANRCAGRYIISVASGIAGLGAITVIATFELNYASGFSAVWWSFLSGAAGLLLASSGFVYYRFRESRCLTMAQYFEVRYSKNFRIFAGILGWLSGLINYGIFPAVSIKFFMFFCKLPEKFILGNFAFDTYTCLLLFAIILGCVFAILGGQIAIMITDFIQGSFCNIVFLILMIFLLYKFNWSDIFSTLQTQAINNPGTSMFNPYDTIKIEDFNIWFFLIGVFGLIYTTGAWQGNSGYHAAATNAHEARMANLLGTLRSMVQVSLFLFIPICAYIFFNHQSYSAEVNELQIAINNIGDQAMQNQARVPLFLTYILPTGLVGMFSAVMFAAMLSTDNTYMHSWGSIFIQDVILPFRKKPFSNKLHMILLRLSIAGVGLFAFIFSMLFKQTEYIYLFFNLTGAIFVGGAGVVIIGGLYSRFGTCLGAWVAMILGSSLAVVGIIIQQIWESFLAPFLINNYQWQWVIDSSKRFPLNGQVLFFLSCIIGILTYILVSWLDHYFFKTPMFNLDRVLHRGQYQLDRNHHNMQDIGQKSIWLRILGVNKEFSFWDKLILICTLGWGVLWLAVFVVGTIFNSWISSYQWLSMWKIYVMAGFFIGIFTTFWFLVGGIIDTKKMFITLGRLKRNEADDGTVINGINAGE